MPRKLAAAKRIRLDATAAQEAILAAAEGLLIERGPDALTLTNLARRVGITHPNVLYHFGSANELQAQLAQRIAVRLAADVARVLEAQAGGRTPIEDAVAAVFHVFGDDGYAKLLAWLVLSGNEPTFDALRTKLDFLRGVLSSHPALRGPENEDRRRRVVSSMELVICAAIGYGLSGRALDGLFEEDPLRPTVGRYTSELLTIALERPDPRS